MSVVADTRGKLSLRRIRQVFGLAPASRQVVVTGFPRSGSTMFFHMLCRASPSAFSPRRETKATRHLSSYHPLIFTKRPLDVFEVDEIVRANRGRKRLDFVFVVRDMRALVSSFHLGLPAQPFQGFDYQMRMTRQGKSMTNPGVLAVARAIDRAVAADAGSCLIVKFEDLVRTPDAVQARLASELGLDFKGRFSDFHLGDIPKDLRAPLNGLRPPDPSAVEAWRTPDKARRVLAQFTLGPALFDVLERWNYETDRDWFSQLEREHGAYRPEHGTVISIPAPQDTPAARRLQESARTLGLTIDLSERDDSRNLPAFLLARRRTLRGPLLFVEAAARLHADPWPYLGLYSGDVAAYVDRAGNVRSEVVLVNDTPAAEVMLAEWARRTDNARGTISNRSVLRDLVQESESGGAPAFHFQRMPPTFCAETREVPRFDHPVFVELHPASARAGARPHGQFSDLRPSSAMRSRWRDGKSQSII